MTKKICLPVLLMLIVCGCAGKNGLRYQLDLDYQMSDIRSDSYSDYQKEVKQRLEANWQALLGSDLDQVKTAVNAHTPTNRPAQCAFVDGKSRGMLLLHGLYDSPYIMKDLEAFFHKNCFHTRRILLPGHGTRPGSLLKIRYEDWVIAVRRAIRQFDTEEVFITGFSTGGLLALNGALQQPKVKGIFLFAPALKLGRVLARFVKGLGADWIPLQSHDDKDFIKYESITLDSVIEVSTLGDMVRKKLMHENRKLNIPVFTVVAKNDSTIKAKTTIELFQKGYFGNQSEMIVYAPNVVGDTCTKGELAGDSSSSLKQPTYINSCFIHEDKRDRYLIADYSHMALTLDWSDDHYGLSGNYKYCLQYIPKSRLREQCERNGSTIKEICFGERKAFGSVKYWPCRWRNLVVRRLTSNPQFDGLERHMNGFIKRYIGIPIRSGD